ncbi:LamG-like jellyroll fold domain-containing protein [Bizionia sediminis]|uniref:LamG-like jellyroll fold domain-containing protein n=1 Tax=Bizionia sediminis TaxID=1737064 RepID=A0ABW5KQD5_9FLAO
MTYNLPIKGFKHFNACCFVLFFVMLNANAQTTPIGFNLVAYEGFDYTSGTSLLNASGGSGWSSNWEQSYQNRYLKTGSSGLTPLGLSVTGKKAEFDETCFGSCNEIASLGRSLPLQNEGVVYLQFISVLEANAGGGTPTIRLLNGTDRTAFIGAGTGSFMSLLNEIGTNIGTSTKNLNAQNIVILRIDYDLNKTEMWVESFLNNFNYANPTNPAITAAGFSPAFDRIDIYIRSGSIDEFTILSKQTTAPTSISGTTEICSGSNTILTASGGKSGLNTVDVWYENMCNTEAFHEGWDTQPYGLVSTTVNTNANGILNVTSESSDPYINMFNLGSFDPTLYKYISFRYRVVSGTANQGQIFFLNGSMTGANGSKVIWKSLISDGQWHTSSIDMSTHPLWTSDGNITGIRYDYTTASGIIMDIDFIELATNPIIGTGASITVSPTSDTGYFVKRKGPGSNTACTSQLVTIKPLPTLINFNNYSKTMFDGAFTISNPTSISSGTFSYASSNPEVASISGNTVTLTGIGTAIITATQAAEGIYCSSTSTATLTVNNVQVVNKYGKITNTDLNYVNSNGLVGGNVGVNSHGASIQTKTYDLVPGMLLYLDANNTESYTGSGTAWSDLSGNGNHGTLQNGVNYSSTNNGSLVFDGIDDYFVTTNNLDLSDTDNLTIQIIFKTTATAAQMILEHSANWNSNNAFGVLSNNNSTDKKIQFTDHNQGYNVSNTTTSLNDGNWHFIAITTDRSLAAVNQNLMYINGNTPSAVNNTGLINDNSGNFTSFPLYIASRAGSLNFFSGNIAQILIYKRVLTPEEIQQNYNAVRVKYGLE